MATEWAGRHVSQKDWTSAIKTVLTKACTLPSENIGVYAHSVNPGTKTDWGEWLWDFVVAKQKAHENLRTEGLNIVDKLLRIAEIEWITTYREIALDFQKLVFGHADLKLYVFPKSTPENNEAIFGFCQSLTKVQGASQQDKYLVIGVPYNEYGPEIVWRSW